MRPHGLYSHGILQVRILGLPTATRLLVHGIVQARILEWVTVSFSRGSSQPRDGTQVSRTAAAAAAKSLQSCPTLCNPIDGSPPGSPCPWDSPGKNTGVGCHSRTAAGLFSSGATRDAPLFTFFRLLARGHAPPWFPSNQTRPRAPPPPASLRRHFLSATGSGVRAGGFSRELGLQGVSRPSREERGFLGPRKPASPPGSVSRWC